MIYLLFLFASIVMTVWLLAYSWRRRHAPGLTAFFLMILVGLLWQIAIFLLLLSPTAGMAVFWFRAQFAAAATAPVLLLVFIARYSGSRRITPAWIIGLLAIPLLTQLVVWTDDRHHLFFEDIVFLEKDGIMFYQAYTTGFWFTVHFIYSMGVFLVAVLWLFIYAAGQYRFFRRQSIAFILGLIPLLIPNIVLLLKPVPPRMPMMPFGFVLMSLCFAWAVFRHKLLEVVPVARNTMFDIMSDCMVVLDNGDRVVDINPAAKTALGLPDGKVVGRPAEQVFSVWPEVLERFSETHAPQSEMRVTDPSGERYFDVNTTIVESGKNNPAGRLILFRDITARKNIEREKDALMADLDRKNKELERLYSLALDANPMSGLPGNNSVAAAITEAMQDGKRSCVIYTDLDNFKAFNDKYGFALGDDVIKFTADLLKKATRAADCEGAFVGHIGGDDFVLVVPSEKALAVVNFIIQEFDSRVVEFYRDEDVNRGFISSQNRQGQREDFPIMSISMAGVDLSRRVYDQYIQVNDACAELKKQSKAKSGSVFSLDQRRRVE